MLDTFSTAELKHINIQPRSGTAAETIVTCDDYADAVTEITSWDGYAKSPLHALQNLSNALELGAIFYKDEGKRFGLGSFKALGGSYAGLRVIQRELSKRLEKEVSARDGPQTDLC